jgi:hypothetical protein
MKGNLIVTSAFLLLVSCGYLPTEQQVSSKYAAEHRGRKVVGVTKTTTGVPQMMKAEFRISYTENDDGVKTDTVRYHQVAEGWVRDEPRQ